MLHLYSTFPTTLQGVVVVICQLFSYSCDAEGGGLFLRGSKAHVHLGQAQAHCVSLWLGMEYSGQQWNPPALAEPSSLQKGCDSCATIILR